MRDIDLTGKAALEVRADDVRHPRHWAGRPTQCRLANISSVVLEFIMERLGAQGMPHEALTLQREQPLSLENCSVDVIVSFYSLERLSPLPPYLDEMLRVLKSCGLRIGAISAKRGSAWGMRRIRTFRLWFKKNTTIDPDKISCWMRPCFVDAIIRVLDARMDPHYLSGWPAPSALPLDPNLIPHFHYRRA